MDWGEGDNALAVRPMIRPPHKAAAWQLPPHRISLRLRLGFCDSPSRGE